MAPPEESPEKGTLVGLAGKLSITTYLLLFSLLLIYSMVQFWPSSPPPGGDPSASSPVMLFHWKIFVTDDVRLILIVAMAGALGGLVHSLRSLYWYVGNRQLVRSWMLMYVLRPFVGTILALIFYFVIRGGLFSPQATVAETSTFGFAGLGGLIGLFSEQAVLKLKDLAETLLSKPAPGADAIPQESKASRGPAGTEKEKQGTKTARES